MGGARSRGVNIGFSEKTCGKEPFGRPRRRWKVNIKMDLRKWNGGYEMDRSGSG